MRDPKIKAFYRHARILEITRIKNDFRKLEPLPESALDGGPSGRFKSIVDSLGHCSPKTRRIACRIMEIWERMHNPDFNRVLADTIYDGQGNLKDCPPEVLMARLYEALLDFQRRQRSLMHEGMIPLSRLLS